MQTILIALIVANFVLSEGSDLSNGSPVKESQTASLSNGQGEGKSLVKPQDIPRQNGSSYGKQHITEDNYHKRQVTDEEEPNQQNNPTDESKLPDDPTKLLV